MDEEQQYQQQRHEEFDTSQQEQDLQDEEAEQEEDQDYLNQQTTFLNNTIASYDVDRTMVEVEESVPSLSVVDDCEQLIQKEMQSIEEEILDVVIEQQVINNWSDLEGRFVGPTIKAGGHDWNLLMFPKGNNQQEYASIYLDLANAKTSNNPDEYACAQFIVCLSKPSNPTKYIIHSAQHRFTSDESDWGFTRFISLEELENYKEDDSIRITTIIRVVKDSNGILWHNFVNYDSKKTTGCVGLQNQGATCYMNSLFQSLYFTNYFKKAVYQIPTENDEPTNSIALALQRVFYNLQFSNTAVNTTELTKSFGWDSLEAFRQHDVQEFNRVLQDNLELKMKNTPADGAIKNLFVGKMKSYIKCINVEFESSRSEDYYDIQLNVKGCKDLKDSFKDYITEETLEGDNKYMAEGYGLQDAKKGVIFESFPPVLHLQLKRFEYDMMRDMMVKINDRHEFPEEIDLKPYLSENADKSKPHKYILHGVLVHSGDLSGGHYFAFVKPEKGGKWLKFDDDRVIPCNKKEVMEENFGGEQANIAGVNMRPNGRPMNRFTNAYMLVYIRETELDNILAPVTVDDIPRHLIERTETEQRIKEQKRKEKEEQHLYMKIIISTIKSFQSNLGFDFINFEDDTNLISTRYKKDASFLDFKSYLSTNLNLNNQFRLWLMVNRQNRTIRIDMPIPDDENDSTMDEIRQKYATNQAALRFYLESPVYSDAIESDQILILIKYFNPQSQLIHGISQLHVSKQDKVSSIVPTLQKMIDCHQDILIYEEIKPNMIDPVDFNASFSQAELQDGDILCIQPKLTAEEEEDIKSRQGFARVDEFMNHELGKVLIFFSPVHPDQISPDLRLILHKEMGYEEMAARVAQELNVDYKKLRLISPYITNKAKRFNGMKLGKILQIASTNSPGNVNKAKFLYEKLDVSLEEIESKCSISVTVCTPTLKHLQVIDLLLPKDSTRDDLINGLLQKSVVFQSRNVRIFDEVDGKFDKEYNNKLWREAVATRPLIRVYAEEIPEEEINMDEDDYFISVFHFQRVPSRTHSVPFKFVLKENEPLAETKKRLQARTGLDDKEWGKVKLFLVADDEETTTAINDDDETLFSSCSYKPGDMIGLDHIDKSTKIDKTGAIFIRG